MLGKLCRVAVEDVGLRTARLNTSPVNRTEKLVSVVVCTHDRMAFLPSCLRSLRDQSCARRDYEVVVVDSACSDETPVWARDFCAAHEGFAYLREEQAGLSRARNSAQRIVRGRYVAFIDDDAQAEPDWIERLVAGFGECGAAPDAVGGEIEPIWGGEEPSWLDDTFRRYLTAGLGWSDVPVFLQPPQWICEANSAYRRDVLERFGPWPEDLGRKGSTLLSNENLINLKIFASGGRIFFDPRVRVRHYIHPDRLTKTWMRRRCFWQGVSEAVVVARYREVAWPDKRNDLRLPTAREDWARLLDDSGPDAAFRQACHRAYDLGYFLQVAGMVEGR